MRDPISLHSHKHLLVSKKIFFNYFYLGLHWVLFDEYRRSLVAESGGCSLVVVLWLLAVGALVADHRLSDVLASVVEQMGSGANGPQ